MTIMECRFSAIGGAPAAPSFALGSEQPSIIAHFRLIISEVSRSRRLNRYLLANALKPSDLS
jgi:hypothetical protein